MASALLEPYELTPDDVGDIIAQLVSVRSAFRAAKTAAEQDLLIDALGVVSQRSVPDQYDVGTASHFEIDAETWCERTHKFMNFISETGLDVNSIVLDAPAAESTWRQTVGLNNRHLVSRALEECGILGPALLQGRSYVRTPAIVAVGAGGHDPSGCGPTRAHAFESDRATPDVFPPRDRIRAHVDGDAVAGQRRGRVRQPDQAISLSTLGYLYMTACDVEDSSSEVTSFARAPFSIFTMTKDARERVKHAVVADPTQFGGVSIVSKIQHPDPRYVHSNSRRVLFADWLEVVTTCGDLFRLDDADVIRRVEFRPAPRELANFKTDGQRLRSVYGGLAARDLGVGIHEVDDEGVHVHCVAGGRKGGRKGGLKARDDGVGIHGMTEEEKSEAGRKGGVATRDAGVGIHGLTAEERFANAQQGGIAARDAGVGVHEVDEEGFRFNAVKGGLKSFAEGKGAHYVNAEGVKENCVKGGKTSAELHMKNKTGIFGRDASKHSEDSTIGGKRGMETLWNRFGAENKQRIRVLFFYGEDKHGEVHEYGVEAIADKIPASTELYHRFRATRATYETLAEVIDAHVDKPVDKKLLLKAVSDIGGSSKSKYTKYAKLRLPAENAMMWDKDYRSTKAFIKKYGFLAKLLRYVYVAESDYDAYDAVVDEKKEKTK